MTASMSEISIIAGGWSLSNIDREKIPGFRIGVNDSGLLLPCDKVVSMDRLWTENRWKKLCFWSRQAHVRRSALQNIKDRPVWLSVFECDHKSSELTETLDRMNGINSGMCALNLAYILRPKRILLWGFDHKRGGYWYKTPEWSQGTGDKRFKEWAGQYERAREQCEAVGIEVLNCNPDSAITAFRKIEPSTLL